MNRLTSIIHTYPCNLSVHELVQILINKICQTSWTVNNIKLLTCDFHYKELKKLYELMTASTHVTGALRILQSRAPPVWRPCPATLHERSIVDHQQIPLLEHLGLGVWAGKKNWLNPLAHACSMLRCPIPQTSSTIRQHKLFVFYSIFIDVYYENLSIRSWRPQLDTNGLPLASPHSAASFCCAILLQPKVLPEVNPKLRRTWHQQVVIHTLVTFLGRYPKDSKVDSHLLKLTTLKTHFAVWPWL